MGNCSYHQGPSLSISFHFIHLNLVSVVKADNRIEIFGIKVSLTNSESQIVEDILLVQHLDVAGNFKVFSILF